MSTVSRVHAHSPAVLCAESSPTSDGRVIGIGVAAGLVLLLVAAPLSVFTVQRRKRLAAFSAI
jgi:hypothetical protein